MCPTNRRELRFPIVTIVLVLINAIIFITIERSSFLSSVILEYGARPVAISRGVGLITPLTAIFLHTSYFHLLGNMIFLCIFGYIAEHGLGRTRFLFVYLASGIFASLFYATVYPGSAAPGVGSSGAIFGLAGVCFLGFPFVKIPIIVFSRVIRIPLVIYVGLMVFYQIASALLIARGMMPAIAYWIHLTGFVIGMILYLSVGKPSEEIEPTV